MLSTAWPYFRKLYGDFPCEPPLSRAMQNFLASRGECAICGRASACSYCHPSETEKPAPTHRRG
jgi:hypothetical protein